MPCITLTRWPPPTIMRDEAGTLVNADTRRSRLRKLAGEIDAYGRENCWSAADVHGLRLRCKRLRGWVRLQPKRKSGVWEQFDADVRALARSVGAIRDQQALHDTLRWLAGIATTAEARQACAAAIACIASPPDNFAVSVQLRAQARRLAATAVLLPVAVEKALLGVLQKNYRRARRFSQKALQRGANADILHRFRKRVKYLQYQLGLLSRHRHPLHKNFNMLGDKLGHIHDLYVLQQRLDQLPLPAPQQALLERLLKQQRKLLRKQLQPLCKHCFAEPRPQLF